MPKETWYDAKDKPFQPGIHYCGRRRHEALRRGALSAPARGLRRVAAPRRDLACLADLVRRHGAVLHEGRAAVRGPRQPRRGRDRGPRQRAVPVPGADPRAAHPAALRRPRAGRLSPVPRPCGVRLPGGRSAQQPVHPVPDLRRLPVPRPGQVRCRDARRPTSARARQRHACGRGAVVTRLETNAAGTAVERVIVERDGVEETYDARHRRDLGRGGQLGQDPARIGQRPTSERAGQRVRTGRPQLHVPQQRGGPGDLEGAQPDDVPEDAGGERLLLRDAGLRLPDGQHPDGRQVRRRDVQGREAARDQARADVRAGRRRHPRGRLLAVDRGPAGARQPGDPRPATATSG